MTDQSRAADIAQTWQVVATLAPFQQQVLLLIYLEELTQPEIAVRLNVPLAVVRNDAARALKLVGAAIVDAATADTSGIGPEPRRG
jgi:DNA-directed RNA polymerase specialized sigma24 family protein